MTEMWSKISLLLLLSLSGWARPITAQDLYDFHWIGEVQVSPQGDLVAFVQVSVDDKKTGYETSVWVAPTQAEGSPRRLTYGSRDRSPRWSPDGRWLAFVGGKEGQLAVVPLSGGEAPILKGLPHAVSAPVWSPDSQQLAFLCDAASDVAGSDVRVITRALYQRNGSGYLNPQHHRQIWIQSLQSESQPRQLTFGPFDVNEAQFAADGSQLIFTTDGQAEACYDPARTDIMTVPSSGGAASPVTRVDMQIGGLRVSPDGRQVAFHGEVAKPVRSYSQPDLWVLNLTEKKMCNLTANYDFDMGSGVAGDNSAPAGDGGNAIQWDGSQLLDTVAREGRAVLVSVDAASGEVQELTHGDQAVQAFGRAADGTTVVKVSTPTLLNELFCVDTQGLRPITHLNRPSFELSPPEEIHYTSFDGRKIQAWIQKPANFTATHKYPLILNIHGGPHAAYGFVFDQEFQLMAARGYVVLYPNPRGSTSYGQEFGNLIQFHYPGDDYLDLMAGVDALLARGDIDEKRLGVTGGSGGGLLTNWTVGHTHRFQAAVSQRDIADWASWWYTADMTSFQAKWFKAAPFDDPGDYARRSPISYVREITTPMMFLLGDEDSRTPPTSGGEQMFRALKYLRRPTVMLRFPRENHDLSRSGEPRHRTERLEHILGWFDKWLLGLPKPEYDPPG